MTYKVSSMYFRSMDLILSSLFSISVAKDLPLGFSARLAISCTALSTVALSSSSNLTISGKGQYARIYILPWFIWEREHSRSETAYLTSFS